MLPGADRGVTIKRIVSLTPMPAAAFAVHQLRYWLAFGEHAGAQLQAQGHAYLHSLVPWLVLLIAVSLGAFLRGLGRAMGGECSLPRYTASFAALWLLCAASLIVMYGVQEFLEGLFAAGHPGGLEGIFGFGGWWSIPAALAIGLVLAALFHGARWVLREVAGRRGVYAVRRPAPAPALRFPGPTRLLRLAPLAGGWSGRGPPRA